VFNSKITKLSILFFIILSILGLIYYLYNYKNRDLNPYSDKYEKLNAIEKINLNVDYLEKENLLKIKDLDLIEYIRVRILFHRFENPKDYIEKFKEEIEQDFPGEKGESILAISDLFLEFEKEKEIIQKDNNLTVYQKHIRIKESRKKNFPEPLHEILFPYHPDEKLETFFLYSKHYCKLNFTESEDTKRHHLSLAKKEIYGDDYDDLILKEPMNRQLEIELLIHEREMSIFTEQERIQKIEKIKKNILKNF
jgi:hypothetical protein